MNEPHSNVKITGVPNGAPVIFTGAANSFPAAPLGKSIEKFVVFFLNERCYGISARFVAEVSRPLDVAFVPRSPEWLAGIANLRGEIIPVLDSAKILNAAAANHSGAAKFIILHAATFDSPAALPVDRLKEIAAFDRKRFVPPPENGAFVFAAVPDQTTLIQLIDTEEMFRSFAFA